MVGNYIRFDWAMKRLLRNKANFGVLEGFLTTLLKERIENARKMKMRGLDDSMISDITGLTIEEISKILKDSSIN